MQRKILLIGATGGIGNKVTEILLKEGFFVIGTSYNNQSSLAPFTSSSSFQASTVNLEDVMSLNTLHDDITKDEDLFAVINCSGIVEYEGNSFENDLSIWNKTIAINLTSNFILAKLFYPSITDNGRFIMISSTDAYYGGALTAAYSASKAGVNSLTKSLSLLFKDKKIRVNTIAPGWVTTPMLETNGDDFRNKVAKINPLKRNAEPVDIANLISFLLSEKSDYINGQIIALEGGYTNQDPTLLLEEQLR